MASKKITRTATILIVFLLLVGALGLGLIGGYNYILKQTERFAAYDRAIQARNNPTPTPTPLPTDASGQTIEPPPSTQPQPTQPTGEPRSTASPDDILITADSPGAIMIFIERGERPDAIAERLEKLGVIENTTLFKLLSKFNGFDSLYQAGTHYVRRGMTYDAIMFTLTQKPSTLRIRFPEDLTYPEFKETLKKHGVVFDEAEMDRMVEDPKLFLDYRFVQGLPTMNPELVANYPSLQQRTWPLQGYLFPDTYDFDVNTSSEDILRTLLDNTDRKLSDKVYERAEELGRSVDTIMILASIIQMESGIYEDMALVSRVFHNRLNREDRLQSCATINYIRKLQGQKPVFIVSNADMAIESRYNTYLGPWLPPGPICSPSLNAIMAALYPDIDQPDLYYFAAKGDGTNAFASTLEGHEANIREYLEPLQQRVDQGQDVPYQPAPTRDPGEQQQGDAGEGEIGGA